MKKILIPLDGSALAEQVLPYAQLLATTLSASIHLLHVIPDFERADVLTHEAEVLGQLSGTRDGEHRQSRQLWTMLGLQAESYLAAPAAWLREVGVETAVEVRFGAPAEVIVEVAEREEATLIAMATHGYSGLKRWALGSVADKVAHATTIPLFLVRSSDEVQASQPALKRIMVPLDGSELAKQALPLATEIATSAQAQLILLQALTTSYDRYPQIELPEEVQRGLHAQTQQELAAVAGELRPYHLPIATAVVAGPAAAAIVETAAKHNLDLIVMATHGYSGLKRWALGSVADKVLHAAPAALLLVRAKMRDG